MKLCFAGAKPEKDQNDQIEVSQMVKWSGPLCRARRDDQNGHMVCNIWSFGWRNMNFARTHTKEDSRRLGKTRRQDGAPEASGTGRAPWTLGRPPYGSHKSASPLGDGLPPPLRSNLSRRLRSVWSDGLCIPPRSGWCSVELLAAFPRLLSSQSLSRVGKDLLLQSVMCVIVIFYTYLSYI